MRLANFAGLALSHVQSNICSLGEDEMGYEIDFLPVGDESKGGDAIALRYGNLHGNRNEQTVVVIDGGYTATGEAMVAHIKNRYGTDRVDMVISTHPDLDHVCGLEVVVEELSVGQLLMHQPWRHSANMDAARKVAFKSSALSDVLEKSLQGASDLESIANRKGIPIVEPFAGMSTPDGALRILGPSEEFYEEMLAAIQGPPAAAKTGLSLRELITKAAALVKETINLETLRDDGTTSPQNNTSVITLLTIDGRRSLLTGDAGIAALEQAVAMLEAEGFEPGTLIFVQVQHHGSRRNVGPSILNRLLGPKGQSEAGSAFVSAPAKNPEGKHPAKKVANAFRRRGYPVHATQGSSKRHHRDAPGRSDYVKSDALPFYDQVEEDGGG